MKTFKDSEGREWVVAINVGSVKRVRDLLKLNGESIDLLNPMAGDPPLITRLFTDLCLLIDVIYCLCRPQAQERKVSDEDFGTAMGGDAAAAAYEAFFGELVDFFQKAGRQEAAQVLTKHLDLVRQQMKAAGEAFDRIADEAPGLIARAMEDETTATLQKLRVGPGSPSTSSPPSPVESIPTT